MKIITEIVNADYGIDCIPSKKEDRHWYNYYKFPLFPIISYKQKDEYNHTAICFSWLNFRIWNRNSFNEFTATFKIEQHGIFLHFIIPNFVIYIWLFHFPEKIKKYLIKKGIF